MPIDLNQEYFAAETAIWLQRKCGEELEFQGCHTFSGVSVPRGARTPTYCRTGKRKWEIQRTFRGIPGLGTGTVIARDTVLNILQEIGCAVNLYVYHSAAGADENPVNYDYFYLYQDVEVNSEDTDPHSVGIDPDADQRITLGMPVEFFSRLKVKALEAVNVDLSALSTDDFNTIAACDDASCDDRGLLNTIGCQTIYIGTAGTTAKILKSTDGSTFSTIATPFTDVTDPIASIDCEDDVVIVVNGTTTEYAYSWNAGTSFTVVETPTQLINRAMVYTGGTKVWFVAQGGYIYYSSNRGASIAAQTSGDLTTQSLNDIAAASSSLLYAIGDSNAFLRTTDGGSLWELVTGPATGIFPNDLYRVTAIPGTDIVFVGDEQGNLYRSEDQGATWTTVLSDADHLGGIRGIAACDCNIIAVAGNDQDPYFYGSAGVGTIKQTIDGGNTWQDIVIPTNTGLLDLVCCDVNRYWSVGVDGFASRISGATL